MAEANLRGILVAFHEKGWNLYESLHSDANAFTPTGPIDNLLPGVYYALMPVVSDPTDITAALKMRTATGIACTNPGYNLGDANNPYWSTFWEVIILGETLKLGRDIEIPLDRAEERLRQRLSQCNINDAKKVFESKAFAWMKNAENRP